MSAISWDRPTRLTSERSVQSTHQAEGVAATNRGRESVVLGTNPNRPVRESNRLRPPFASESAIEQPAATRRLSQRARLCLGFVYTHRDPPGRTSDTA